MFWDVPLSTFVSAGSAKYMRLKTRPARYRTCDVSLVIVGVVTPTDIRASIFFFLFFFLFITFDTVLKKVIGPQLA